MDLERQRRIKSIAESALELDGEARAAYLDAECGGDAELRAAASRLLDSLHAADATDFLGAGTAAVPTELGGEHRYRILRELGRGGMGTVYLGERADGEFRQLVAIKLLHWETSDAEAQRRLRAERQILADLEHPNIARLIDGGSLADGRPFLVMEYVDGQRLDTWATERGLDRTSRVRLFIKVCAAVSHAHQHLVVHRDLKPGNILVDARGEPKLLDFGIAKLLGGDRSLETATQDRLLTVAYASPEQVRGGSVGTASDVYSLGVVLYRLLTGRLPYRVPEDSAAALAHAVCTEPPTPASGRIAKGDPTRLDIDSDLDHILLKALRKEPEQRYRSVEQFCEDLQRYLDGEPVLARRGSRVYRWQKFLQRHALAVAAAALVLALITGFGLDRQRQLGETVRERDRAQRLLELMTGLFENADPEKSGGKKVLVADLLDGAARRARVDAGQQPLDRAAMLHTLGDVYRTLGDFEQASALLVEARDLRASAAGAALEVAASESALGVLEQQKRELDAAAAHYARALPMLEKSFGPDHWRSAEARARLALVERDRGNFDAAQQGLQSALAAMLRGMRLQQVPSAIDTARPREAWLALAALLLNLGQNAHERKDWARAAPWIEQSLALRRQLHARNDPVITQPLTVLANLARERGDLHRATELREEILAIREQAYGPDHWQVGVALVNLGDGYGALARNQEARAVAERAEKIFTRVFGPNHPYTLIALGNQAHTAVQPSLEKALELAGEVLRRRRLVLAADHPDIALALYQLGVTLAKMERHAESLENFSQSFAIYAKHYGAEHPYLDDNRVSEAEVLVKLGRIEEAIARLRAAVAHDGHPDANPLVTAQAKFQLGKLLYEDPETRSEGLALAQAAATVATREGKSDALDPVAIDAWLAAHAR